MGLKDGRFFRCSHSSRPPQDLHLSTCLDHTTDQNFVKQLRGASPPGSSARCHTMLRAPLRRNWLRLTPHHVLHHDDALPRPETAHAVETRQAQEVELGRIRGIADRHDSPRLYLHSKLPSAMGIYDPRDLDADHERHHLAIDDGIACPFDCARVGSAEGVRRRISTSARTAKRDTAHTTSERDGAILPVPTAAPSRSRSAESRASRGGQ